MVKVKLVESRLKTSVGTVMVVKVMIQSNKAGMSLAKAKRARVRVAIHVVDGETLGVTARAEVGAVAVALLRKELMALKVMFGFPCSGDPIAAAATTSHLGRHRLGLCLGNMRWVGGRLCA